MALVVALLATLASCGQGSTPTPTPEHTTHNFGEWSVTKNATCTEDGVKTRYCSCGEKQSDAIPATGHNKQVIPAVESTCTENGLTEGIKCLDCGEILVTQTIIPVIDHSFGDWLTVKNPTVTEQGTKERYCACGEKETEIIHAKGSEGLKFTSKGDGTCYVSGIGTCTDTDIVIPSTYNGLPVTSIGNYAFYGCSSLTGVVIPDSVTSIGEGAFNYCSSLSGVVIPDSVTSIGDDAFWGCSSLNSVVIPDSVTSIGEWAFVGCSSLTSIVIPNSVTSIGEYAFYDCDSLTSVVIPDSVTSIGDRAFASCDSLTEIKVDSNNANYKDINGNLYTKGGKTLIQYAIGKSDIHFVIPDSVTSIGVGAFGFCSSLTSIVIPNSVTSIGVGAFCECISLTSVVIPSSVTSIGSDAFDYCSSLTEIKVDSNNANYKDINGNLYTKEGKTLIQYAIGKSDTHFVIPNGVTSIGNSAFKDCSRLTSVVIPDSVTSIGNWAFEDCSSLTSIKYRGTQSQWNAISKGSHWDEYYDVYGYHKLNYTITYNYKGE